MPGHAKTRPRCFAEVERLFAVAVGGTADVNADMRERLRSNKRIRPWIPQGGLWRAYAKAKQFKNHYLWRANIQQRAANLRSTWATLRRGFAAAKLPWRKERILAGSWTVETCDPAGEWLTVAHVSAPFPGPRLTPDPPPVVVESVGVFTFPSGYVLDVAAWVQRTTPGGVR